MNRRWRWGDKKRALRWLRRLLADTLGKRLFLLMWGALVLSHLVAYVAVRWAYLPAGPGLVAGMPTFPSLPPTPGLLERQGPRPPMPQSSAPAGFEHEALAPPPPGRHEPGGGRQMPGRGLPAEALLLDYGLRLLVIGLAAWWGSRWLAAPVRRLVRAADGLGAAISNAQPPAALDEHSGTLEVREAALVFNQMALQLHQQFKARGLLMAAISHDLRTPMTRLRMRLETLQLAPQALARSVADLHEMNAMVDQALALYRGHAVVEVEQSCELTALLQSLCDDLAEQGQAVSFVPPGPDAATAICKLQVQNLRRILDNLIGNALRYGGQADITMTASNDGTCSGWLISVADKGPGIPTEQLEAVFQPFYRTESSRMQPDCRSSGGSGLGLYIARDLAGLMGAKLSLHPRPEGGLCANLYLPQR
ncbi:ATP-binding protein [Roseateles oligotrophus]|uniref:histidine kinase n=1 Tax=Roseateles oligotrophus TaxID=1769250 RepID=A0ABT2YKK6_9BURK|nr:ATP-binding protein [Roseateles oligotrophus]MCV2370589.1 two-component sensor histidine kinase [Roseateles oligotrophus]